jgi:hypothetical protein
MVLCGGVVLAVEKVLGVGLSCGKMDIMNTQSSSLTIDRSAFSVVSLNTASEELSYWLTQSPQARIRHMQRLRQINYGSSASERLQRVLEVVELERV